MAHSHAHGHAGHAHGGGHGGGETRGRRLLVALALNVGIALAEGVGGVLSGSLSLLADAAHNLSDAGSILVSYIAWRISRRQADRRLTFGYARAETVGALINLTTLFVVGLYLLWEAGARFFAPQEVVGTTMLIVGFVALAEDAAAAWVLRKEGGLNVRSTFLHMIADALATVGVIVAALAVIAFGPSASWVDPAVTAAIAIYIFVHAYREIRSAIAVLMDTAPDGFDYDALVAELKAAPTVAGLHHLHVWQREEGVVALEAHLELHETDLGAATETKEALKRALAERFGIRHATLEIEAAGRVSHGQALVGCAP